MIQNVVIAGAGIGGLTLAVALARRGIEAVALESAPELAPLGAGLALQPNAMRALAHLGLDQAVRGAGAEITRAAILDPTGRGIGAEPDGGAMTAALGAPTIALHRARLHRALLETAGAERVRLGARVVGFREHDDGVEVALADGSSVTGELLVGAD